MKEKIALCGDNCAVCPRYRARDAAELRAVAELWYRIGWRDRVVSDGEIACAGCTAQQPCTYRLVACAEAHAVKKCRQCGNYPCEKIREMLKRSADDRIRCREICTEQEYLMLEKAFFEKARNLEK